MSIARAIRSILPVMLLGFTAFAEDIPAEAPAQDAVSGQAQVPVPVPVPVPVQGDANGGDPAKILEEALSLRDPFKRPEAALAEAITVSDLELYPTEQFKLVGVITGASRLRAILQDPKGKTHFVSERMHIGTRRGVIRKIRADVVIVREKVVNVLGKEESLESEIRLPSESKGSSG